VNISASISILSMDLGIDSISKTATKDPHFKKKKRQPYIRREHFAVTRVKHTYTNKNSRLYLNVLVFGICDVMGKLELEFKL
jgi:hypothetical protein